MEMDRTQLQWLLIGIGAVIVVLIFLWGIRSSIKEGLRNRRRRPEREPVLGETQAPFAGDNDGPVQHDFGDLGYLTPDPVSYTHLDVYKRQIQQGLMRTGMVRFGSIIPRLRRVVRQASQDMGKRAELLVGGEESEVDRTVLENMVAPLEHMLRNSLAHGIETPEQRRSVGKSDIGTITLSLRREGAELVLELGDDGSGLNFNAIRTKGEEKGLLLPGQPATPEELIALLLRPGFSTATAVTQISGRGVGMDVVNEAIREMCIRDRSMDEVSTKTAASAEVAEKSVGIAHEGGDRVRHTIHGMNVIREHIQDTSKRIKRLGRCV